ncbi:MAG TPA: integrase core domain-containing protein [Candidatus Limnocylindria bacterium]|nr:integrase core domain-containing protein [Candidatus Limnocylindria bacterium]
MDEIKTGYGHERRPDRRWLRHTYQEGPGFRFLATRGGHPPGPRPARDLALVRLRARCVRVARDDGVAAALALGLCSRASLFRWQAASARNGLAGLIPERRGPRQPTLVHPAWIELVVITVRLHTYWNSKRIAAELRRREIATVSEFWIETLFDRLGTARPSRPHLPSDIRSERATPNELWPIDIKGPFFIQLERKRYLKTWIIGLVDDHSRFVLGLRIQTTIAAAPILAWLRDCIELCGQPIALMSDNGTPFVTWMPGVLTQFGKTLRELEIRHIRTQVNSPWTNGKVERFWGVLQQEVLDREIFRSLSDAEAALARYANYFNYHRLHGELGWLTPAERFDGTPFADRGFEHVPALSHLEAWLAELMAAA